jgi:hypothetical protein
MTSIDISKFAKASKFTTYKIKFNEFKGKKEVCNIKDCTLKYYSHNPIKIITSIYKHYEYFRNPVETINAENLIDIIKYILGSKKRIVFSFCLKGNCRLYLCNTDKLGKECKHAFLCRKFDKSGNICCSGTILFEKLNNNNSTESTYNIYIDNLSGTYKPLPSNVDKLIELLNKYNEDKKVKIYFISTKSEDGLKLYCKKMKNSENFSTLCEKNIKKK